MQWYVVDSSPVNYDVVTLSYSINFNSCVIHFCNQSISINDNQLTGPIPSMLGRLEDLVHLSLNSNALTGNVPSDLAGCFRLKELNIDSNKLEGNIPAQYGQLSQLEKFRLQSNSFVDTMPPQICALRDIELSVLIADCGQEGKITCDCCSQCK